MLACLCLFVAHGLLRAHHTNHPVPVTTTEDGVLHPVALDHPEPILQPFLEVHEKCGFSAVEMPECVDQEPFGEAREHQFRRRYVCLTLVLIVAVWSCCNELFFKGARIYTKKKQGQKGLDVLHALFQEVTVLGFIALLTEVMISTGHLKAVSLMIFGSLPEHTGHGAESAEHMAEAPAEISEPAADEAAAAHGAFISLSTSGESAAFARALVQAGSAVLVRNTTAAASPVNGTLAGSRYLDVRDGRTLSELTVLFEDVHVLLFLVMISLVCVAFLNLHQLNRAVNEWDHAEELAVKHTPDEAMRILRSLASSDSCGFFQKNYYCRQIRYLMFRREFLAPTGGNPPAGVDTATFPFLDYLKHCAGSAVVDTVEVPLWLHGLNSFLVLVLRPAFSLSTSSALYFICCVPYGLAMLFGLMWLHVLRIQDRMAIAPLAPEKLHGRPFAIEAHRAHDKHGGTPPPTKMNWILATIKKKTNGTLHPNSYHSLFWFHRHGPRVLAGAARTFLFWVAVFMAVLVFDAFKQHRYTWMHQLWMFPVSLFPVYIILFHIYPGLTLTRVLVTSTEYSPNREAIDEILAEQAAQVRYVKEETVRLLRREKMRGLLRTASEKGTAELEAAFEQLPARTTHFIDKAYLTFDSNDNGFLDAREFRRCLMSLKLYEEESRSTSGARSYKRTDYVRPAAEEWFQLLSPDMRGVTQGQFKAIVWALTSANDVALEEGMVLQCLKQLCPKTSMVNAVALENLLVSLTRISKAGHSIGHALLRESYLLKSETRVMPHGYQAKLQEIAHLIVVIDHDLATQQGLD